MQHQEGYFENIENASIYFQTWMPTQTIKAVILIVHGLGEHSGRYGNFINRFVPQGFAIYGFDHLGHGKSSGRKGHIDQFSTYLADVNLMVDRIKLAHPDIPLVIFGHSMGGLISSSYLVQNQHKVSAVVLSSPAIKAPNTVPEFLLKIGKWLSAFWPTLGVIRLESEGICRNEAVVQAYQEDPLVHHGKISARLGQELLNQMCWLKHNMHLIRVPVLVIQGGHDSLVDPVGAAELIDHLGSKTKKLVMYKGLYHELINEPEREVVLNDIELWVRERLCLYVAQESVSQFKKMG